MNFHSQTIDILANRLLCTHNYALVCPYIKYNIGEIDLFAYRELKYKYFLFFEVKSKDCPKYRKKARNQLERHAKTFGSLANRVFKFYVYPSTDKYYTIEWVKLQNGNNENI